MSVTKLKNNASKGGANLYAYGGSNLLTINTLIEAGRPYPDFFVSGGYADSDSGGFVLAELSRNIRICVTEKTRKVACVRANYSEWWLVLVDRIGYGIDERDHEEVRQLFQFEHSWNKIVLVNPLDATQGYEL